MEPKILPSPEERLRRLERRLKALQAVGALGLLILGTLAFALNRTIPATADQSANVLRVRGLIIEDAWGHERILLGAPVPKVPGRKRQDDVTGLIVLGENGADRIALAYPVPDPQIKGKISKRISPSAGLVVNDPEGNERGGFGAFDDGRVVLGLDYPDNEAVSLSVIPEWGFAGLTINAETGSPSERAELGVFKDGMSLLKLADTTGMERVMLLVRPQSAAKLVGINPGQGAMLDVAVVRLNPYRRKRLLVKPQSLLGELEKIKP